jgi:hypothetical protein
MLINLSGTYCHYCAIDDGTVSALLAAGSMGRFYNASIKGNFDCRVNRVPNTTTTAATTTTTINDSSSEVSNLHPKWRRNRTLWPRSEL